VFEKENNARVKHISARQSFIARKKKGGMLGVW
jgi:hypothetical protein